MFQRDRDRVIHSTAFRRLQYKTQVFVSHEGDHYRTRLTHSLEVAQIARSIARALALEEDLAEALALAHDLGHGPFGHAGEEALDQAMQPHGGFSHNDQTLRVMIRLERRYADFDGLNLTWETLEGTVKHNGPLAKQSLPTTISDYVRQHDLEIETWPSLEAQVAAISDDIAYNNHDIDDGLRAGLFTIKDLADLPLVGPIFAAVAARYPETEEPRLIHEAIRRLIDHMVGDVVREGRHRIAAAGIRQVADVRALGAPAIGFSATMRENDQALRAFLMQRMYRHYRVNRMAAKAKRIVRELFELFLDDPICLPTEWRDETRGTETARVIADYIAGMTDRYALDEHSRLFDRYATT